MRTNTCPWRRPGDVTITEGRSVHAYDLNVKTTSSRTFGSKTTTHNAKGESDTAIATELSADTISIVSGGDFTLQGSTVAAVNGLSV